MRQKTGGRKAGTPNKISDLVKNRLDELECDPIEQLVIIARQAQARDDLQLAGSMYKELASYIAPKVKSIELTESVEVPEALNIIITHAEDNVKLANTRH